jgi:hypothetical protein
VFAEAVLPRRSVGHKTEKLLNVRYLTKYRGIKICAPRRPASVASSQIRTLETISVTNLQHPACNDLFNTRFAG